MIGTCAREQLQFSHYFLFCFTLIILYHPAAARPYSIIYAYAALQYSITDYGVRPTYLRYRTYGSLSSMGSLLILLAGP